MKTKGRAWLLLEDSGDGMTPRGIALESEDVQAWLDGDARRDAKIFDIFVAAP